MERSAKQIAFTLSVKAHSENCLDSASFRFKGLAAFSEHGCWHTGPDGGAMLELIDRWPRGMRTESTRHVGSTPTTGRRCNRRGGSDAGAVMAGRP